MAPRGGAGLATAVRPWVRADCSLGFALSTSSRNPQRRALGALFAMLAVAFAGVAFAAGYGAGTEARRWIVVLAAAALAIWLATLAVRALR
jgi:hypothetical protein